MTGRGIFGFFMTLLFVGVLIAIGAGIYQAGVAQGVIDAGRFPAGAPVPVSGYGDGYHGGFGFLGLLFPLLFLFLIFGLVRAAFSRGRGWGHPGHGRGYGPGWGGGWDKGDGPMGGPGQWREERDQRMSELHRRLHEEDGGSAAGPGGTSATGQ
ncbi:MAG: hypothetical protein ABI620_02070 [Chloroflexota bacterium]